MFQIQSAQPNVQPEKLFEIGSLAISNAMITGVFVTVIFLFFALYVKRSVRLQVGGFQTLVEMTVESFLNLIQSITGNRKAAEQLLPLIGALFLFIGFGNLIALIPGVTSFTYEGTPLFRTATNDFNMTFSIALAMIILTQIASLRSFGFFGHLGKYFKFKGIFTGFKQGLGAGVLAIVDFLIGLLDIISEIAKVISLSLRLFGNMYAGDMLAAILLGALAIMVPAPWLAMNLLVGVLQALVFGALTAAYYTLAVEQEEA